MGSRIDYEVMVASGLDGKPVLRQTGPGSKTVFHMRHVTVFALTERTARTIQTRYRQDQTANA